LQDSKKGIVCALTAKQRLLGGPTYVRISGQQPPRHEKCGERRLAGADRDEVLEQMKGRVRAKGELLGTFKRPDRPAKP
jgi:hypothetical protein